jgi:hypothetical protein
MAKMGDEDNGWKRWEMVASWRGGIGKRDGMIR